MESLHRAVAAGLPDENAVAIVNTYFDESGKFTDHTIVAFSGVVANADDIDAFSRHWRRLLRQSGLSFLTMKDALNAKKPLSASKEAIGHEARCAALAPFARCIRKHFEILIIQAVDVVAFAKMPEHVKNKLRNDPHYIAVASGIAGFVDGIEPGNYVSIFCDDEESTAQPIYKFYRKIKLAFPAFRKKLASLTFADDEIYPPLQAADMVASLSRLEAGYHFASTEYEYAELFEMVCNPNEGLSIINFWDSVRLPQLATKYEELIKNYGHHVPSFAE